MNSEFSKNQEKRPRSSSESNKSFVRNVTSRVSGLLPATITKWFSSPSSSNTNGSAQMADATDSSTEDEAPESLVIVQPPAKRMRYNTPGNFNQIAPVETRCTSTNTESVEEVYNAVNSPVIRSNIRRDNSFVSAPLNLTYNETTDTTTQDSLKSQPFSMGQSMTMKRKSLFDNPNDDPYKTPSSTRSGSVRDPYFKPSLLSSPFYLGRTMYGGAASSYMTQPNIKKRKISLRENETSNSNSVTISHSTRRVMDLLEHYSSPLIEAKRIPQVPRNYADNYSFHNSSQQHVNPYEPKISSYKTQELYVPSVANILTIKRKSRLMDTTNAARQIIASHSSSSDFSPYPETNSEGDSFKTSSDKLTTKVKSRLTRTNREKQNIEIETNVTDTINLPTGILQIDKDDLPKFTFGSSQILQTSKTLSIQTPVIIAPDSLKRSVESVRPASSKIKCAESDEPSQGDNDRDYIFSSPDDVLNDSNKRSPCSTKFSFGSPERNIEKAQELKNVDDQIRPVSVINSQNVTEKKVSLPKSSDWKCLDCWIMNKADVKICVCCGGKKPVEVDDNIKKCSLCNFTTSQLKFGKCTECDKKTNSIDKLLVAKETNNSKWKCNNCYVENLERVSKCVCCGGANSKKTPQPTVINSSENNSVSEWKCDDCWVKNKSSLDKCAACGGLKPGSKLTSSTFGLSALPKSNQGLAETKEISDSTFKNIAKPQRWECPICLVRNENNRATCICCEADKPGTVQETHKKLFNFHQPSEITFKFGIQPKSQGTSKKQEYIETYESCMGEESETNNNVLPKTPTFNFGVPHKKNNDQSETPTERPVEAPKINFTFGVTKQDVSPIKSPIFGIPKLPEVTKNTEETEKPQEVPRVFTSPKSEVTQQNNLLFKANVNAQNSLETPTTVPLHLSNQPASSKTEASFYNTSLLPTTNVEAKTQQNSFTFSTIKPSTSLFSTTTTVTTTLSAPLSLSTPATSTVSLFQTVDATTTTTSFFQANSSATTTAVSFFPKAELTTTTASTCVTKPIFSFGNQESIPQVEKPKFLFSFTSNKPETSSLFNPTFGVSNDSNISTNKFNLPSNSISTGNSLSKRPLSSTTQVNTANTLSTGNPLTTVPATNLFGTGTVQKENMWSANNVLFTPNTTANTVPKPPTFTFGTPTPFNTNNSTFGSNTQPAQNVFGITNQSQPTSQPSMFTNQLQNQTTPNIFGTPQAANNSMSMGMFGTPNANAPPAFGTSNPSIPSFETPSLNPAPAPTFNFGAQQPAGIFGFGQQPSQGPPQVEGQQPQQAGIYSFGSTGPATQLQFNMGSAPNTAGRRVIRKAMRRTQR